MTQVFYQNTVVAAPYVNDVMIDDVHHCTSISEHASGFEELSEMDGNM